jgi:hypothetical protein
MHPAVSHDRSAVHISHKTWLIDSNATFSNISSISWRLVLIVEEADHWLATGKLYHSRLRVEGTFFSIYKAGNEPILKENGLNRITKNML